MQNNDIKIILKPFVSGFNQGKRPFYSSDSHCFRFFRKYFVDAIDSEDCIDFKSFGLGNITIDELLNQLRTIYGFNH